VCDDQVHLAVDQFGGEPWQPPWIIHPTDLNRHVLVRDITSFSEAPTEGSHELWVQTNAQDTYQGHRSRLRARREGPPCHRAAEKGNKLPSLHDGPLCTPKPLVSLQRASVLTICRIPGIATYPGACKPCPLTRPASAPPRTSPVIC